MDFDFINVKFFKRTLGYQVLMNADRVLNQNKVCFQDLHKKYKARIDQKQQKTTSV